MFLLQSEKKAAQIFHHHDIIIVIFFFFTFLFLPFVFQSLHFVLFISFDDRLELISLFSVARSLVSIVYTAHNFKAFYLMLV